MIKDKELTKIKTFVKDRIVDSPSMLVITTISGGYKVNDLKVQLVDEHWSILDAKGHAVSHLRNQRLAVLTAALTATKRYMKAANLANLDMQLSTLKHDKSFFETKIAKNSKNSELFEDRLSKTSSDLSLLYEQISELEKSVGLQ
jgi:hypothetical protein